MQASKNYYRTYLLTGTSHSTKDMYTAMCAFLLLELKLFCKLKKFYTTQVGALPHEQLNAILQAIRNEFPISKFNEVLMEYFDACMASSEGKISKATKETMNKFEYIKELLFAIRHNLDLKIIL